MGFLWPKTPSCLYRDRVQDGEIVAAIVAGEPSGIAAAYDRYAPALYGYCRSLLTEPADAADAVQDTFIIAAGKTGGLRDPERFRPWLYAVARNECFRRLRARGLSAPLDEAGEVTADEEDPSAGPERAELRALVASALAGLNPGDREVIELNLRHVLDGPDLADALGVGRNQAYALVSRARSQFEGSLGALLVARAGLRAGQRGCPDLEEILADWDGNLTILLRKRINRHIEHCEECGESKRRELSPAMLLSMLPMVALPAALRDQVFRLVSDSSPAGVGYRDLVIRRAGPYDRSGFPRPIESPGRVYGLRTMTVAASAAVVAAALLGTGTVFVLDGLHHKGAPPVIAASLGPNAAPAPLASSSDRASSHAGKQHQGSGGSRSGGGLSPDSTPQPTPNPGASSAPGGQGGGGGNPNPTPTTRSHSSSPPPSSPPPSPGSLTAAPDTVTLTADSSGTYTGSFQITAVGGPVSGYSIEDPAPSGDLSISPSGGSLSSGATATITMSVPPGSGLAYETDLTVDPGGLTIVVDYPPAG
jgi:RNA polymerase sigma factor (sigma-70 family)